MSTLFSPMDKAIGAQEMIQQMQLSGGMRHRRTKSATKYGKGRRGTNPHSQNMGILQQYT